MEIIINNAHSRRTFLGAGARIAALSGLAAIPLLGACAKKEEEDIEVSPVEDLMQEHGLLNRILLIYDHCRIQLESKQNFDSAQLLKAATILRAFVEDYHEKQEEQYIFPRFDKSDEHRGLVKTLTDQHNVGRNITTKIMQLCKYSSFTDSDQEKLINLLFSFNAMYRPHEAREDTVLFRDLRTIISKHEYDALGEEFEKTEQRIFGKDGFDMMLNKVSEVERAIGIYDLASFTPKL